MTPGSVIRTGGSWGTRSKIIDGMDTYRDTHEVDLLALLSVVVAGFIVLIVHEYYSHPQPAAAVDKYVTKKIAYKYVGILSTELYVAKLKVLC